ncbi:MAG: hypothetical protein ACXWQO_01850, partial [Bdellovibrionota bacterium]
WDLPLICGFFFLGMAKLPNAVKLLVFFFWLPLTHSYQNYLLTWGVLPRAQTIAGFDLVSMSLAGHAPIWGQVLCRLGIGCLLLILYLISKKRKKLQEAWPQLIVWLIFLAGALAISRDSWLSPFGWNFTIYFSSCVFAFSYFQIFRTTLGGQSLAAGLAIGVQSLAIGSGLPFVRSPDSFRAGSREDFAVCQLKALKLLLWSKILDFARGILSHFFFFNPMHHRVLFGELPSLHWPNYVQLGIARYSDLHLPLPQIWLTVLLNAVSFILWLSYASGYSIALLRLTGIYVPRAVIRPYLATTFNGYFRRLLFYYSEVLVHFFLFPARKFLLTKVDSRLWRGNLSLFFAVSVGGLIFHLIKNTDYFMFFGFFPATAFFFSQWPYFCLMGLMSCISASGVVSRMTGDRFPAGINIFLIFIAHALLLTLIGTNPRDGLDQHLVLLRVLLGLH